jgi:hypothetical protein
MKYLIVPISLITALLSAAQEVSAIAVPPIDQDLGIQKPVEFSAPPATVSLSPEYGLIVLLLLSIPVGKLLHKSYRSHRMRTLRQQVDALERVWKITNQKGL